MSPEEKHIRGSIYFQIISQRRNMSPMTAMSMADEVYSKWVQNQTLQIPELINRAFHELDFPGQMNKILNE